MIIKEYIVIYEVYDEDKVVMIRAIVHGSIDWQNKIQNK